MKHAITIVVALGVGCAASPELNLGDVPDASAAGRGGAGGSAGGGGFGGIGGGAGEGNALTAKITEPPSEMAIAVVTIACADDCKQLLAIASGGNPPYDFAWGDGATAAARTVCSDDGDDLSLRVSDSPVVDREFPYSGQVATASVTITRLPCPDAGAVDAGTADASASDAASDASMHDAGVGGTCAGRLNHTASRTCPIRTSHLCPGSTNVAVDLTRAIEPGQARCFELHAAAPILGQTNAYLSLGRDCMPLEGQGSWGNAIDGYVFGVCFEAIAERATQIIVSPGLGYFDDAYRFAECDRCPAL